MLSYYLQYDFGGWMPNSPLTLQRPPPTKKGEATEATMLATFPDINATVWVMLTLNLLSNPSTDFVSGQAFNSNSEVNMNKYIFVLL